MKSNQSLHDYLEKRKVDFEERGTVFMVPIVEEIISRNLTDISELNTILDEYKAKRNAEVTHSIAFQFYWSMMTYITDMIDRYDDYIQNNH